MYSTVKLADLAILYNNLHHILLVDDDSFLHKLVGELLSAHQCRIEVITNGEEIYPSLQAKIPDLIIMDILMPGRNGLYWLCWIKENYPQIPVLILSARNSADDRITGLEMGAEDYLTKPFHPKELLIRVRNILRHRTKPNNHLIRIGHHYFDPVHELFIRDNNPVKLTSSESHLLEFFCQHTGQTLTRDDISYALHGSEYHPMKRSIDMHVNRLRRKIGDDPANPRYLLTVWRKGYRLVRDE